MSFLGSNYGMWGASDSELGEAYNNLNACSQALNQWVAHARKLEKALDEIKKTNGELHDMYIDQTGNAKSQAALKNEALKEIERLDPSNKLLDPNYRQAIFDKTKEASEKEMRKK